MVYRIVSERDNAKVTTERNSLLVAVARARVWASEGWQVVVTDGDGKVIEAADFDQILAA